MIQELKLKCATTSPRYTTRDGLISAGVLLAATLVLLTAGIWLNRNGYHETGEAVKGLAFPIATLVSMPFAILKGQSRRVQTFFILVPTAILIGIGYLSTKI